jgi:hypothetical protein
LLSSKNSSFSYYPGQQHSPEEIRRTVTLRYVNKYTQKKELRNFVRAIQQITPNEDNQARIAISLVQNIPYDWNTFTTTVLIGSTPMKFFIQTQASVVKSQFYWFAFCASSDTVAQF